MSLPLRLSVQEQMIPGETLEEKFTLAKQLGYDAIELRGRGDFAFEKRLEEFERAKQAGVVMPTECVEMSHFIGAFDDTLRRDAIENMKSQLTTMARIGGHGVVTPAAWGMFSYRLPPFTPPRTPEEDHDILIAVLTELGEHAQKVGTHLLLEPLNRYEDHMINTMARAKELCDEVGLDSLGIVADVYHMNIEEDDLRNSIHASKDRLKHVQLGDSSRYQPGTGHVDWQTILGALIDIEYSGTMALECRLRGEPEVALRDAARFMREQWQRALDTKGKE